METPQTVINEPVRASIVVLVLRILVAFIITDTVYFIIRLLFFDLNPAFIPRSIQFAILVLLLLVFYVIQLTLVIFIVLSWIGVSYYIDEKSIVVRKGIFRLEEKVFPINDVKTVSTQQGIFGKMFNYGNVDVMIASPPVHEEIGMLDIPNPHGIESHIKSFL